MASDKVTILLADEDALRRDGLAAVLQGHSAFQIVAQCPDGETAMDQVRHLRPDVAVVDLNLSKVHGIELVRRIRGEMLGTKIVIMSGTDDDDIVREVVRAGGDAFLLKNGPARHLFDAISYVRDGGQYFSPQLRRDGLDRRLLEEPPRIPYDRAAALALKAHDERPSAGEGGQLRRNDRMRERLREDASTNLGDRDYEILDMMAEGIRPILDRLDEIEGRIGDMESGEAVVPKNVRGWLDTQIADTYRTAGRSGKELSLGRTLGDIEARLPQLIEEAVSARFQNMANKLQQEVEETHLRTLEAFVKNIQVKLVQRVSALEIDMSKQAEAMRQLREYSQRTEDNLSRLISGVDKLAQELPRRLPPPASETIVDAEPLAPTVNNKPVRADLKAPRTGRRRSSSRKKVALAWIGILTVASAFVLISRVTSAKHDETASTRAIAPSVSGSDTPQPLKSVTKPSAGADTKTKMQAAEEYSDRKEYSMAENIYKQVLQSEPNNPDAMKGLASVLYRQDKIEESAAILAKLPKTN
jgi:DNA-binding NarL/FixJ family response regulator